MGLNQPDIHMKPTRVAKERSTLTDGYAGNEHHGRGQQLDFASTASGPFSLLETLS